MTSISTVSAQHHHIAATAQFQDMILLYFVEHNASNEHLHVNPFPSRSPVSRIQSRTRLQEHLTTNGAQQRCYSETHVIDSFSTWGFSSRFV